MKTKKQTNNLMKPNNTLSAPPSALSAELRALQRQRAVFIKSRVMIANRLQAIVAGTLSYHSGMAEKDRTKAFAAAAALIKQIANGEAASDLHSLVMMHQTGIDEFNRMQAALEKSMVKLAKQLPVAAWVEKPEQRGFGLLFLAIVIGETGDLANYANPGKLWRRLGCAPYAFDGQNHMGSTWRFGKEGKLPAAEWERFGYSPRRRSIAYLIGEGIVRQNGMIAKKAGKTEITNGNLDGAIGAGPYRLRWLDAKRKVYATHPEWDWKPCDKCGKKPDPDCQTCGGTGKKCLRANRHAMLLATKLLLKNLWLEWNNYPAKPDC